MGIWSLLPVIVLFGLFLLGKWFTVLREYERGVSFWLGKLAENTKGPGFVFVYWPLETIERVSLRTVVLDVPPQDVITKDNVSVKVNAVVYYRVVDPSKAVVEVVDYNYATSQLAQTTLRSVLGQAELDELLSERDKLNDQLQEIVDAQTDPWGFKVTAVEVKHVDLPQEMQRAMAKQAEAEREKRAKVIHAEGEFQASKTLAKAAHEVSRNPVTLQLRYLQTLSDIATERNSTILFPLPIEMMRAFGRQMGIHGMEEPVTSAPSPDEKETPATENPSS
jgi:regulator of protease activity HflC (stomatin/prohibitin superfamily)